MIYVTCRLTAKNRYQLWNPTLGNRVWAAFTFFYYKLKVTSLGDVLQSINFTGKYTLV